MQLKIQLYFVKTQTEEYANMQWNLNATIILVFECFSNK